MILTLTIPGVPISGNHRTGRTPEGGTYIKAEAKEYASRIRSIATAAALQIGWKMPDYVRMDLVIYDSRCDRDNVHKTVADSLQGIAYEFDSRILDGIIRRYKDPGQPRVQVQVEAVNGSAYGFDTPRLRSPRPLAKHPKPVDRERLEDIAPRWVGDMLPSQSSAEARRRTAAALATNTAIAPAISFAERDKLLRTHRKG